MIRMLQLESIIIPMLQFDSKTLLKTIVTKNGKIVWKYGLF